jgi:hypothetical protein
MRCERATAGRPAAGAATAGRTGRGRRANRSAFDRQPEGRVATGASCRHTHRHTTRRTSRHTAGPAGARHAHDTARTALRRHRQRRQRARHVFQAMVTDTPYSMLMHPEVQGELSRHAARA